jgi:hypothetical protein
MQPSQPGPTSFRELIALWPTPGILAADIGRSRNTVTSWVRRNSVPSNAWSDLVNSAARNGIKGVSIEAIAKLITAARP